jgi:hypothetical protein
VQTLSYVGTLPTTTSSHVSLNELRLGFHITTADADGEQAEVAIYTAALTLADAAQLAKYSPDSVRPADLAHYWPLISGQRMDVTGAQDQATGAGTPTSVSHPPVIRRSAVFYSFPAAAGGITVTPGAGSLAFTGFAPTVTFDFRVAPGVGSLALTGFAPTATVTSEIVVAPGAGSLTFTGFAPTVAFDFRVAPGVGSVALTGFAPAITVAPPGETVVQPGVGSLTLTGYAPVLTFDFRVQPPAGSMTITGYAPTVTARGEIIATPGVGSLTLTGYAPTVAFDFRVTPPAGSLAIVGYAPVVTGGTGLVVPSTDGGGHPGRQRRKPRIVYTGRQRHLVTSIAQERRVIEAYRRQLEEEQQFTSEPEQQRKVKIQIKRVETRLKRLAERDEFWVERLKKEDEELILILM